MALSELILVGGGAHLKGLADQLQGRLKIQVSVPDPLAGISQEPMALQGSAGAMPLSFVPALGAVLSAGRGINLLPTEVKQALQRQIQRAALTGVLTAVVVGALLLRIGMGVYEKTLATQIAAFELERTAMAAEMTQAQAALAAQERQRAEPRWEELFKNLSQILPRELYLTGLAVGEKRVALRGHARQFGRPSDQLLAEFLKVLEEGPFTQVHLTSTRQLEGPTAEAEFEIQCFLK